jgi:ubiquinol-cytochrome c reductase iron-sulfur subunit
VKLLKHTLWEKGTRLARDPNGIPIKASDVTIGSVFHVIPENLHESDHPLEEKAKAAVLLMRLDPADLHVSEERKDWNFRGIVAYSKICTHVGCPVALYEQQTHHLLCPCHQSQFDITREAEVIFGPAKRPLPQLPITVDEEGYLVAQSDFHEPVGPSFWERSL